MLTTADLNRALLARQLLLERSRLPLTRALERVGGIQAQYAPSSYIGLWSRLDGFALADLTRSLEQRRAVQGTLLRSTIHLVSARDYWGFALGSRSARQAAWLRFDKKRLTSADLEAAAKEVRSALAGRVEHRDELLGNGKKPTVAMFCTGGIRCEKSTAFLKAEGIEEVFHLKGGILKYLEDMPEEQSLWQGECYVFDERVSVGHGLVPGGYTSCKGCGRPLSVADRASEHFVEGLHCPYCDGNTK